MPRRRAATVLAAIDVGTNAVRLELSHPRPDGTLEKLHDERAPVRPGEGVFKTGSIPKATADRLISTLRRYAALCQRYDARVRAVATSAVREARNKDDIVRRAKEEAGIDLEVISGQEEARLICLGVLQGTPPRQRSLVVDIGGGSTEIIHALGETPKNLWSFYVGAVRLTELFDSAGKVSDRTLGIMRSYAADALRDKLSADDVPNLPHAALGSSGTIQALVAHAGDRGAGRASLKDISRAVDGLATLGEGERRRLFDEKRAEVIVGGAVVLEAVMRHFEIKEISSVDRGLRDGLLLDLLRKQSNSGVDATLGEATASLGRRFGIDEKHARHVAELSLVLFDQLASLHGLPAAARPIFEVAAYLHDVGHSVSYAKHHRHSAYLIENADLPGLTVAERQLAALVARFHRRSAPERTHELLEHLPPKNFEIVRKLSTLLRIADSLDRSHNQPVIAISAAVRRDAVLIRARTKAAIDLEIWDVEHELPLFRRVFGKRLDIASTRR